MAHPMVLAPARLPLPRHAEELRARARRDHARVWRAHGGDPRRGEREADMRKPLNEPEDCPICHYVIGHAKDCHSRTLRLLLEVRAERDELQSVVAELRAALGE